MKKTRTLKNYRRLVRYYEYLKSQSPLTAHLWANNHIEDILYCLWENNIPYTINGNIEKWDLQLMLFGKDKFFVNEEYYDYLYDDYHEEDSCWYTDKDWDNEDAVIRAIHQLYRHGIIKAINPKKYNNFDFQFVTFNKRNIKQYRIFKRNMRILKEKSFKYEFKGNVLHINTCNIYITIRA